MFGYNFLISLKRSFVEISPGLINLVASIATISAPALTTALTSSIVGVI